MDMSLFFARFLGLYFFIVSVLWFLKKHHFEAIIHEFCHSRTAIFFSGVFSLIFGLFIILLNPILQWDWKGLITILGALAIIKGIFRMAFTDYVHKIVPVLFRRGYWIAPLLLFVIGWVLLYHGFYCVT